MFEKVKSFFVNINPLVRFFLTASIIVILILLILDYEFHSNWNDILVEAHGLLFDLILFGIILTIYDIKNKRKDKVERLKEELDDYRGWDEQEAMYRNVGIIKRLHNLEMFEIDLTLCNLSGAQLWRSCFSDVYFFRTNLSKANLFHCYLSGARFYRTNLIETLLGESDLREAIIMNADLTRAELFDTDLSEAFLINIILSGADLTNATLLGAHVDSKDFLKSLSDNKGIEQIRQKYYVDETPVYFNYVFHYKLNRNLYTIREKKEELIRKK